MVYYLNIATSQSTNAAANQSTVNVTGTISTDQYTSYWGLSASWGINIGGAGYGGAGTSTLNTSSSWSFSASRTFTHDANGYRGSVGTSCSYSIGSPVNYNNSVGGTTYGAIDYDRKPAAPTTVTPVLNADKSITVTSNAVDSPAGTPTYYISWSSSADLGTTWSAWSAYHTIGSNARSYTYTLGSLQAGLTYRFRMYASNTDGSSAATTSATTVFLPAGAKVWNGTEWKNGTIASIYTDTGWKPLTTAKIYNGTSWVNLT